MSSDANLVYKEKHANRKPSPLVGEGVNRQVDGRGKCEQKHKKYFYRTVLNTCPSFLNKAKKWSETNVIIPILSIAQE